MDTIRNRVGEVYEPFKVRFLEREIHALADDEVLVRVRASAICGSDLHIDVNRLIVFSNFASVPRLGSSL